MKSRVVTRKARLSDVSELLRIDEEIWPNFRATEEMFRLRIEVYPEGQFVATVKSRVVGAIFTQRINYVEWENRNFTWNEITDKGTIRNTHQPSGESLYGVGLTVAKSFQDGTVSQKLIVAGAIQPAIRLNLPQILLGSRIPAYHRHTEIPSNKYIYAKSKSGRLLDPELALYKKFGGEPIRSLPEYMYDPQSLNFGVLVRWKNPFYGKHFRRSIAWLIPHLSKYL